MPGARAAACDVSRCNIEHFEPLGNLDLRVYLVDTSDFGPTLGTVDSLHIRMAKLPAAYIASLAPDRPSKGIDGIVESTLERWIDKLRDEGVRTPSIGSLIAGELHIDELQRPLLLALGDSTRQCVGRWAGHLAAAGYSSIVACAGREPGSGGHIDRRDMPLLTGHGIAVASRGLSGRPLVELPVEALRRELKESRRRLSQMAGYPVGILMPAPTPTGAAVDGLVCREARRAGYRLVLRPGRAVSQLDEDAGERKLRLVDYRTLRTDDSAEHLRDWAVGKPLARGLAQVRALVNRPRRFLRELGSP